MYSRIIFSVISFLSFISGATACSDLTTCPNFRTLNQQALHYCDARIQPHIDNIPLENREASLNSFKRSKCMCMQNYFKRINHIELINANENCNN